MSAAKPSFAETVAIVRSGRYRQGDEFALHDALATRLRAAGVIFEREVILGPGERIDFLCTDGLGIECKTRADKRATFRQLERYAKHERVSALLLVSATSLGLPPELNGKPLFYVSLGRCAL